jgi:NusA-like protein
MASAAEILAAFRELSNAKQLERAELYGLLQDGILAALAKKYGPTVQAEVDIDEGKGDIKIVLLRTVVDVVEDAAREITTEDARLFDESFEVGDVLEEPIDFAVFGRAAVQAAKQRIIQRVREGERARIREEFTSKVGACVGLKGSRVQAVVNELGGERIDIVPWSPDPERFARLALAPARVAKVFSDPEAKTIQAVVDEDQLSLAIGRNGQNVRLASELTGWKIDLYSSREWLERGGEGPLFAPLPPEEEMAGKVPLAELKGLSPELTGILENAGYKMLNDILDLEREDIAKIPGMTPETSDQLMAFVSELTDEDSGEESRPRA